MDAIYESIQKKLSEIEEKENVRIIYACESGSRAWGFASPDSDYDVRFVYVRPVEEYLKLEGCRDVLEAELNDVYDISGWDLSKLLKLLTKSNPVIFEWADSPIVYKSTESWSRVVDILPEYFSPSKGMYHYVSMAKGNIREHFQGPDVNRKKYFYVLRPLLAFEWIQHKKCPPPTEFSKLVDAVLPDEFRESVEILLEEKMKAGEKERGPHIPALEGWIAQKLSEASAYLETASEKSPVNWQSVDACFRDIVLKA